MQSLGHKTYFNCVDIIWNNNGFIFIHIIQPIPFPSTQFQVFVWIILRRYCDGACLTIIWKTFNVHFTTCFNTNISRPFDQTFAWLTITGNYLDFHLLEFIISSLGSFMINFSLIETFIERWKFVEAIDDGKNRMPYQFWAQMYRTNIAKNTGVPG